MSKTGRQGLGEEERFPKPRDNYGMAAPSRQGRRVFFSSAKGALEKNLPASLDRFRLPKSFLVIWKILLDLLA
jgi:hypothetical protein